ncbi:serine/threonine-protein kinase HipA [Methylobacillus rhizosphaerae]|uniref:Serine/threonine-protein kinase HipA n=1 Tax=Methylobacillus rhizosphaerae TaxID=551994 RepID=A0A238YB47_9PROT|nr:type II toxin-antitoxin system HipA family toxin [Methylobacillus rhizosphaerae]SNR68250.1 serine/threonine-protein kinase HipA [Methylobacillus rhizosphaerae]
MALAGYTPVNRIIVKIWGQEVGRLALDPNTGYYAFAYAREFCETGIELSPIQAPAEFGKVYVFPDLAMHTYHRLPAFLADALPDRFGNALVNRYMADHGVPAEAITPLDRLAYQGSRAMGALTFEPDARPFAQYSSAIELAQLVSGAREALTGNFADNHEAREALHRLIEVGTSAGGARAKAVIAMHPVTKEIRSGQMDTPAGFEHWLLKFDGIHDNELEMSQGYGRIEYAYYLMAIAAGINMMESQLLEENGRAHFMTRRFDRNAETRNHIQTLCAMAHLDFNVRETNSYGQLFACIKRLNLPYKDLEEAFRRMVFNVMAKNCDDHTKNISFILPQQHAWRLAPAYDISFAYNPHGEWTYQHLMAVNGKFKEITPADMLAEAQRYGIGTAKNVIEEVHNAVGRWQEAAEIAGVSESQYQHIAALLLT